MIFYTLIEIIYKLPDKLAFFWCCIAQFNNKFLK